MDTVTEKYVDETRTKILKALQSEGIQFPSWELRTLIDNYLFDRYGLHENRFMKLKANYKPAPDTVKKICELNDGLLERFREPYNELKATCEKVAKEIVSGEIPATGYFIEVQFFIGYNIGEEGIQTANRSLLYVLSDKSFTLPYFYSDDDKFSTLPDYDKLIEEEFCLEYDGVKHSADFDGFYIPELEKHFFYFFMHWIFCDSMAFYAYDMEHLKPEDFSWQIHVEYNRYDKDADEDNKKE